MYTIAECEQLLSTIKPILKVLNMGDYIDTLDEAILRAQNDKQNSQLILVSILDKFNHTKTELLKKIVSMNGQVDVEDSKARIRESIGKIEEFLSQDQDKIAVLSNDVASHLLSFFDNKSLFNFNLTSKKNNAIGSTDKIWQQKCLLNEIDINKKETNETFKQLFIKHSKECFIRIFSLTEIDDNFNDEHVKEQLLEILSILAGDKIDIFTTRAELAKFNFFNQIGEFTCDVGFSFTKKGFLAILNEYFVSKERKVLDKLFERPITVIDRLDRKHTIPAFKTSVVKAKIEIDENINDKSSKQNKCLIM